MSLATAAEYVLMLTAADPQPPAGAPGPGRLSARERELVTLVAQGRTDTQIAAQLYISVRTVSSHLDRLRRRLGDPAGRGSAARVVIQTGQFPEHGGIDIAPAGLGEDMTPDRLSTR